MRALPAFAVVAALCCAARALEPSGRGEVVVDRFEQGEEGSLPPGWRALPFKKVPRQTRYFLAAEQGEKFVRAVSSSSASALVREVDVALSSHPRLAWRWKVDGVLKTSDPRRKSGDDYAARVYVAFAYDPKEAGPWERLKYGTAKALYGAYPPKAVLNYVWDSRLPEGTELPNAYTGRAMMVVLRSGAERAGQWLSEERDVAADYRRLFGEEPPEVSFVALMTDTDDTGESAGASYDDLVFREQRR